MPHRDAFQLDWSKLPIDKQHVLDHFWGHCLIGMTFIDEKGYFVNPNPALCQLLEYTSSELEKLTYADITHPADLNDDMEMATRVMRGDIPFYVMSIRYLSKRGRVILIKLHVSAFFANNDSDFLLFFSQIAPAEIYDPVAPAVKKAKPIETQIRLFVQRNWKWLLPATSAAIAGSYKAYRAYETLMQIAQKQDG